MQNFTLYDGVNTIEILADNDLYHIIKLCSIQNTIFLLNTCNELYSGIVEPSKKSAQFRLVKRAILDVECHKDNIYIVDQNGCVYKTIVENLFANEWIEIVVPNPKTCPHGFKSITEKVQISQINCNNDGILFTTFNRELFAVGNFGEVITSDMPVPVVCFSGFKILQVTTGDNFVVVLTHKKPHTGHAEDDYSEEGSDNSPIYLNTECPQCAPETIDFMPQATSSKSTTDTSIASSGSQSDVFELENSYSSTWEQDITIPSKWRKDVALNFLLESLSITSEDAGKQTKIIKENVSNITSMVYEGVKTLSRHMSGSDNNDDDCTEEQPTTHSCEIEEKITKNHDFSECAESICEEFSVDMGSATDLQSECDVANKIAKLCRMGANMLGTSVWCFGSVNKGQLGTGDHMKRTRINPVLGLTGQGVVKISSGKEHSIAMTLDGRLYLWGNNSQHQITTEEFDDVSAPRKYRNSQNTLDAICGNFSTFILLNDLTIKELKKSKSEDESRLKKIKIRNCIPTSLPQKRYPLFLALDNYYLQNHSNIVNIEKHVTDEQKFLQQSLTSYITVIKPFLKKIYFVNKSQIFDQLCQQYLNIINITTVNVKSMYNYFNGACGSQDIVLLNNSIEMISAYRTYTKHFCDVACVQGFNTMNSILDKAKDGKKIFLDPFRRVWSYIEFIWVLIDLDNSEAGKMYLEEKKTEWQKFFFEKDSCIELAERTAEFWENSGKSLIPKLQSPNRKLILDSKKTLLKIIPSGRFTTHWFILFSDIFCHNSSTLNTYPLEILWTSSITDNDTSKYAFKVITPEETFVLVASNHENKMKWLDNIEKGIKDCLEKPNFSKVPQYRNASYTFSVKHPKYAVAKYFGRWYVGKMHGIGHLEFADGRVYNGQIDKGEITGFGRLFTPTIGIYEGDFVNGKYHGYGVFEMRNNGGIYEGNFKDGLQHGHGILRTNNFTYIGEFANNLQNGYGVLDDAISGDKYMGMFVDGKRSGFGVTITVDGNYFEGVFIGDHLSGDGVAVFANGSYFEGDLTIAGPNGKGILCMPIYEVKTEAIEVEDQNIEMNGNVLSGSLSGGWNDVKISHGNITMQQSFSKFPRSLGLLATDHNRKWRSLFQDWENDVFGPPSALDHKQIWNKIAVFIANSKRKGKLKSDGFSTKNAHSWNQNHDKKSSVNKYANLDQASVKSSHSLTSKLSKRSIGSLHSKIHELFNETNSNNDSIKMHNEVMYDNIKQEADLVEIFKFKKDASENILNSSTISFDGSKRGSKTKFGHLDFTPCFGITKLDKQDLMLLKEYLTDAFKDTNHPFGILNRKISYCFYTSYGCWKVKPTSVLSGQAMKEWQMISKKIYSILRRLFPALPLENDNYDGEFVSHQSLLYPILLSEGVYSTLFVLYASKCSQYDELYRQRLLICEKKSDEELVSFLRIDSNLLALIKSSQFEKAVHSLKQVKEKYCPWEMLKQIENTFQLLSDAKSEVLGNNNNLNADNIMPLTIFIILRSGIPHLGAEILLLEDLMGADFEPVMLGFAGYCFTTIKAAYQHILSDKFFQE